LNLIFGRIEKEKKRKEKKRKENEKVRFQIY